jgi:hypothetical protein
MMLFMPFSPRWLVNKKRDYEAIDVLAKLRDSSPSSILVQNEYNEIKSSALTEKKIGNATWEELTKRGIFNRVIFAACLQMFQQWTGTCPNINQRNQHHPLLRWRFV